MRIAIGADHRGSDAVDRLVERLSRDGHDVSRFGSSGGTSCDYPEAAFDVSTRVAGGDADRGILICGTGVGMGIAANKVAGVRAATVHDELTAQLSRSHNDANVICLSADLLGDRLIDTIVDAFIGTEFEGGRHGRRVNKIAAIERGDEPAGVS
ncbi:MAG: ribose 5-phosphate isomerase B [Planctomycetota bacterium]